MTVFWVGPSRCWTVPAVGSPFSLLFARLLVDGGNSLRRSIWIVRKFDGLNHYRL